MKKELIFATIMTAMTNLAFADSSIYASGSTDKIVNQEHSWQFTLGGTYQRYQMRLPTYSGRHHQVGEDDTSYLTGTELSISRGLSLSENLKTYFSIDITSITNRNRENGLGSEEVDINLSEIIDRYNMHTATANIGVTYQIHAGKVQIEPFIEGGAGIGKSYTRRDYSFDGVPGADMAENYNMRLKEDLIVAKAAVGINFVAYQGITSYIKASQYRYGRKNREVTGQYTDAAQNSVELDKLLPGIDSDSTVYSLGVGYAF